MKRWEVITHSNNHQSFLDFQSLQKYLSAKRPDWNWVRAGLFHHMPWPTGESLPLKYERDLSPHPQSGTGPHTLPSHVRVPETWVYKKGHQPGSRGMAELPGALSSSCLLSPSLPLSWMRASPWWDFPCLWCPGCCGPQPLLPLEPAAETHTCETHLGKTQALWTGRNLQKCTEASPQPPAPLPHHHLGLMHWGLDHRTEGRGILVLIMGPQPCHHLPPPSARSSPSAREQPVLRP